MVYTAETVQNSITGMYHPNQGCACGTCSIGTTVLECNINEKGVHDWHIGNEDCCGGFCPQRKKCVPIDVKTCSLGFNEKGEDPVLKADWEKKAPNVTCTYDKTKMSDIKIVQAYQEKYGKDSNWKDMMVRLCSQQSQKCGVDPITGKPFAVCSNMNSTTETGDSCRLYYNEESQKVRDSIVQDYCLRYPNSVDCSCVERLRDQRYRDLKRYAPFNDGCWYAPCTTPSYLTTAEVKDPTCPSNVCQIIFDTLNNNNVNINENKNSINCTFPSKPVNPPPSPSPSPSPPPPPPNNTSAAFWMGGVIAIGILVLGLMTVWRR